MTRRSALIAHVLYTLPLAAGLLCSTGTASAQTNEVVNIPFAFSANHHSVAAGTYQVQMISDRFVSLRNIKTHQSQVLMVRPDQGRAIESQGRLIFRRVAGRNYLQQVYLAGTSSHSELSVHPKLEKQYAQTAWPSAATFELALK